MNQELNNIQSGAFDRFSWRRVWAFGNIFRSIISRQLLVYGAFSLLAAATMLIPFGGATQVGIFSLFSTVLSFLYYLSPAALCKRGDTRMVMNMAPALPNEKFVFFMIYFLIILPVVISLPYKISEYIYLACPSIQTPLMKDMLEISLAHKSNYVMQMVQGVVITLICLHVVLACHGNRTLKAVLTVFAILVGIGLIGAIIGFSTAFMEGYEFMENIENTDPEAPFENVSQLMTNLKMQTTVLAIVSLIVGVVTAWLIRRRLAHPKI